MDLLNGRIRPLYFKYLSAAFGSALISSIYGMVDMAMVGQYQGPDGTAALAVVAPVWNVIYSLGLLTGIGGSVIFSARRGSSSDGSENQYFSAAVIGSVVSLLVLLSHFLRRRNTLRLARVERLPRKLWEITVSGFSSFFIDVAMGILTVLFNRQIMRYLGGSALAVYGPIINVSTFVQCCAYSVGQAAQPIISINYGAGKGSRIRETLRLALYTTAAFALFWTALSFAAPNLYIRVFMSPTPEILTIAPAIIRAYALSFLLLPFNIFSTYYFQSIMQPRAAFIVSVARGLVISGVLILLLPQLAGPDSLWFAMPVTELLTAVYTALAIRKYTKRL